MPQQIFIYYHLWNEMYCIHVCMYIVHICIFLICSQFTFMLLCDWLINWCSSQPESHLKYERRRRLSSPASWRRCVAPWRLSWRHHDVDDVVVVVVWGPARPGARPQGVGAAAPHRTCAGAYISVEARHGAVLGLLHRCVGKELWGWKSAFSLR